MFNKPNSTPISLDLFDIHSAPNPKIPALKTRFPPPSGYFIDNFLNKGKFTKTYQKELEAVTLNLFFSPQNQKINVKEQPTSRQSGGPLGCLVP